MLKIITTCVMLIHTDGYNSEALVYDKNISCDLCNKIDKELGEKLNNTVICIKQKVQK